MKLTHLSHSGKFQLCAIALALAAGSNAYAATVTSATINPDSVFDNTLTGGSMTGLSGLGAFTINQYTGGVLTGASFSALLAAEPINFTSNIIGTGNTVGGSAWGTAGVSLVTGTATSSAITTTGVTSAAPTTGTIAAYTVTGSATTQAQLDALYGSGTVNGNVSETLSVNLTQQSSSGKKLIADNSANRTAAVTYDYTSLNHANGGFNSAAGDNTLSLSFNSVANGSTPTALGFDLYNLVGSYGLQVKSVVQNSGAGVFSLTGLTDANLAAGSSVNNSINMSTLTNGLHTGQWSITVADSAFGLGAGKNLTNTEVLTLNVSGTVTPVPEPESYAMLLAGLGLMGTIARRRNKDKNA